MCGRVNFVLCEQHELSASNGVCLWHLTLHRTLRAVEHFQHVPHEAPEQGSNIQQFSLTPSGTKQRSEREGSQCVYPSEKRASGFCANVCYRKKKARARLIFLIDIFFCFHNMNQNRSFLVDKNRYFLLIYLSIFIIPIINRYFIDNSIDSEQVFLNILSDRWIQFGMILPSIYNNRKMHFPQYGAKERSRAEKAAFTLTCAGYLLVGHFLLSFLLLFHDNKKCCTCFVYLHFPYRNHPFPPPPFSTNTHSQLTREAPKTGVNLYNFCLIDDGNKTQNARQQKPQQEQQLGARPQIRSVHKNFCIIQGENIQYQIECIKNTRTHVSQPINSIM